MEIAQEESSASEQTDNLTPTICCSAGPSSTGKRASIGHAEAVAEESG